MNFLLAYTDPDELLADHEAQFALHGILVRVTAPAGLERDLAVTLTVTLGKAAAELEAQVLHVVPEVGVALTFEDDAPLTPLLDYARSHTGAGGAPAEHRLEEKPPEAPVEAPPPPKQKPRGPTRGTKIRQARYGDRPERDAILRDTDRSLQRFVLTNPGLSIGEVKFLAGQATTLPQTLKAIAEKREWASRSEIAMAVLRNPRTPIPVAIKILPNVNIGELRVLVRSGHLRTAILNAARKRTT